MPDLTSKVLPRKQSHRLPGLDLGDGFVYPDYAGGSILNIPSTVCRLLGVPELRGGVLAPEILAPLEEGGFRRVLLILMDALSLHQLQRWMASDIAPIWNTLLSNGVLAPVTSIVPSTTSAALLSLWTGLSTCQHGVTGYEMLMKEYGMVVNMISHAPASFRGENGSLSQAGFKPGEYLQVNTLGSHLAAHGVRAYAAQPDNILRSGLSQMFYKDVTVHGFNTAADLWVNMRHLLEAHPGERLYAYVYWSELDHLSHLYAPDDERPAADFQAFSEAFERLFLQRLSPEARRDTLVILTADHGQIPTRKNPRYDLAQHPRLAQWLHILPTGENRLAYLYLRSGQNEDVSAYIEQTWPDQFALFDPAQAVKAGLFGPGEPHPHLLDRLGDMIMAARNHAYLRWSDKENRLLGRHGGLSPDEMLVPFLAVAL
jgi:hypothetical protein